LWARSWHYSISQLKVTALNICDRGLLLKPDLLAFISRTMVATYRHCSSGASGSGTLVISVLSLLLSVCLASVCQFLQRHVLRRTPAFGVYLGFGGQLAYLEGRNPLLLNINF
jgi:hypothetical protein